MRKFEWDSGMNLGIKAIDDDHKRLFGIIKRLFEATKDSLAQTELEDIFVELEEYTHRHFAREESMMRRCNYVDFEDHVKQHRAFASMIPNLKSRLLNASSYEVAQDVNLYLIEWLMSHILQEDFNFVDTFEADGMCDRREDKKGKLKQFIYQRLNLGFEKSIFLLAATPLLGLMLLGGYIYYSASQTSKNIALLKQASQSVSKINILAHTLQLERGFSSGYMGSHHSSFTDYLYKQRDISDDQIAKFSDNIKSIKPLYSSSYNKKIATVLENLETLPLLRAQVDSASIDIVSMLERYTAIITDAIDLSVDIKPAVADHKLSTLYSALEMILYIKESMGIKRAHWVYIAEQSGITNQEKLRFAKLLGRLDGYYELFEQISMSESEVPTLRDSDRELREKITLLEQQLLLGDLSTDSLDSKKLFIMLTDDIDNIQRLGDQLVDQIDLSSQAQIEKIGKNEFFAAIFVILVLLLTFTIFFLSKKIILLPIRLITRAMQGLASGKRSFRFKEKLPQDEFGEMAKAYETCRRNLLKSDLLTALYINRQDIQIEEKFRENKELQALADIDSLTSLINRRKFDELFKLELSRALRYNQTFALLMLDLDHFKKINDSYGHVAGDQVLKVFASTCKNMVRDSDIVARVGGEEFVILLLKTEQKSALSMANRVCRAVEKLKIEYEHQILQVTTSIGVVVLDPKERGVDTQKLYSRADRALYDAKHEGRNRVKLYADS